MEFLKLLSASEIVAQIISFLILFFILRIFAWKKILQLLDQRREYIANEFKDIERAKLDINKIKSDYEAKIFHIDDQARSIIKEAIKEGTIVADSIKKQAHIEGEKIIENARLQLSSELEKAKETLKIKIIDLAVEATEKVIKERMDDEHDKKLVADFIERLDQAK
ncbi:MAG: F0F1 ATP synthase subunit B [Candidatus Omnitrophota bacterium]